MVKTQSHLLRSTALIFACMLSLFSCKKPAEEVIQEEDKTSFITIWDLSKRKTVKDSVKFYISRSGAVAYSWEEIGGNSRINQRGSGRITTNTFTLMNAPEGAKIRLILSPDSLKSVSISSDMLIDISQWGTTAWTSMFSAFGSCINLNCTASDLPDLSRVKSTFAMFADDINLTGPSNIENWNMENVTDVSLMFSGAVNFNQPIGNWNTSKVTSFGEVLYTAKAFNQYLGGWSLAKLDGESLSRSLSNCGMDDINYSNTLKAWADQVNCPQNVEISVDGLKYNDEGEIARNYLIQTKGWTFLGDSKK